jgi:hypothetical protein
MADVTEDIASVDESLREDGQIVVITSQSAGAYNVEDSTIPITETTQNVYGIVFDWGGQNYPSYGQGYIDQTLIKTGDQRLILSALNTSGLPITEPVLGSLATIGSVVYTIVPPLKLLKPSGTLIMVDCNIRV